MLVRNLISGTYSNSVEGMACHRAQNVGDGRVRDCQAGALKGVIDVIFLEFYRLKDGSVSYVSGLRWACFAH